MPVLITTLVTTLPVLLLVLLLRATKNAAVIMTTASAASARQYKESTTGAVTSAMTKTTAMDADSVADLAAYEADGAFLYSVGTRDWGVKPVHGIIVSLL